MTIEAQNQGEELTRELEEKLYELERIIRDKEQAIQKLEKIKVHGEQCESLIEYNDVRHDKNENS